MLLRLSGLLCLEFEHGCSVMATEAAAELQNAVCQDVSFSKSQRAAVMRSIQAFAFLVLDAHLQGLCCWSLIMYILNTSWPEPPALPLEYPAAGTVVAQDALRRYALCIWQGMSWTERVQVNKL